MSASGRRVLPALVVAAGRLEAEHGLLWVLMITSAENRRWNDDVPISNNRTAGLPAPSVVRCAKIATIEVAETQRIGQLPLPDRAEVTERFNSHAALAPERPARRRR